MDSNIVPLPIRKGLKRRHPWQSDLPEDQRNRQIQRALIELRHACMKARGADGYADLLKCLESEARLTAIMGEKFGGAVKS